jgi:general secretion pathway protein H
MSTAGNDSVVAESPGSAGFTLLELVVVLVILGIVLGVTVPRFGGLLGRGELTWTTKALSAYLRNAKELAVVRNVPVRVSIDPAARYFAASGDGVSLDRFDIPESIGVTVEIDRNRSTDEDEIVFFPLGHATRSRIILESEKGKEMIVEIEELTGDVHVR